MRADPAVRLAGRVMGTSYEVVVHRDDVAATAGAAARLDDLERRWSRFLEDSELSELNRSPGVPVIVSPETYAVIAAAVDGARATGGRFDPTVAASVRAAGYDRDFDAVGPTAPAASRPAPGVDGIELDPALHAVTLPEGVTLDLGGIGKGAAADLVSREIVERGARGVAVAVGGDVRVRGQSPTGGGWSPGGHGHDAGLPPLLDGGVCTSSTRQRRWCTTAGDPVHHLIDPRTGAPTSGIDAVTVIAATARQAEILTKAAVVAGADAPEMLESFGATAVITWTAAV